MCPSYVLHAAVALFVIALYMLVSFYFKVGEDTTPAAPVVPVVVPPVEVVAAPVELVGRESYEAVCTGTKIRDACFTGDVLDNVEGKYIAECPSTHPTFSIEGCVASDGTLVSHLPCNDGYVHQYGRCFKQCPVGYEPKGSLCINGPSSVIPRVCPDGDVNINDRCYRPCPSGTTPFESDRTRCKK